MLHLHNSLSLDLLRISRDPASMTKHLHMAVDADVEEAARLLRVGELVAFQTETVYGLGADATNETAVAKIYAAKERPSFNPLISHVSSIEAAFELGEATPTAEKVAEAFWPGPLTLVLKRKADCPIAWLTSSGLETIALRVPRSEAARVLLQRVGRPVAAPSANRSGRISPTSAAHVLSELERRIAAILDGGACSVGLESTVIDLSGEAVRLLRPGAVTREMLEAEIGPVQSAAPDGTLVAPGMMESHYAPNAAVRLDAVERRDDEAFLDFGGQVAGADLDLSRSGDLVEAAANLFGMLRTLDEDGALTIAVAPIPAVRLGEAIRDRLQRAAAPRP